MVKLHTEYENNRPKTVEVVRRTRNKAKLKISESKKGHNCGWIGGTVKSFTLRTPALDGWDV